MCGRYITGELSWAEIHDLLSMPLHLEVEPRARFNVAPATPVPVLRPGSATGGAADEVHLAELRWGVQPDWARSLLINAQAEKWLGGGRSYWKSGWQRCILPAWGYYEWKKVPGQKKKQPMALHDPDGIPLAMAGLWRPWDGEEELGAVAVILTTAPGADIAEIHDRMPALLPWSEAGAWLDPQRSRDEAGALLGPREGLEAYPVDARVGRVAEDDEKLIQPLQGALS
ncbi:MAG: SOS response-associated peptidase [Deltaproteobacteria bacterium]|nr:SOS response-associated peptidase [Deltaproteobacteria bacterium]